MEYIIKKNYKLDDCVKIFENNNKNFVFDKNSITDPTYTKFVLVDTCDKVLGYAVIYPHNDFITREEFECDYTPESNSVYIWHIIVHSDYCNRGIGKIINNAIKNEYNTRPIYCAIDSTNVASMNMHLKQGFKVVKEFKQLFHGVDTNFALMKYNFE